MRLILTHPSGVLDYQIQFSTWEEAEEWKEAHPEYRKCEIYDASDWDRND